MPNELYDFLNKFYLLNFLYITIKIFTIEFDKIL